MRSGEDGSLDDLSLDDLLTHLEEADVRLTAHGTALRYDAPARRAGPALEAALRRHKPALLARLTPEGDVEERESASEEQWGLVSRHEASAEPQVWNISLRIQLEGALDVEALRVALEGLIHRHQSLRCRFVWQRHDEEAGAGAATGAGNPSRNLQEQPPVPKLWQEVLAARPVALPVEDLRHLPERERAERLEAACARISQTPFDMARGVRPLLRLVRTGAESFTLMLVLHHVSCDGWSVSVLLGELGQLYGNAVGAASAEPLAPPTGQCTDYARRQASEVLTEEEYRRRLEFWAGQLAGCEEESGLPADHPRPERLSGKGLTTRAGVPAELFDSIRRFAREQGTTPFAVTTAVLGTVLHRLTGRDELVLNTAYANRAHPGTRTLVTCTAAALPVRLRTGGGGTLAELCRQATGSLAGAVANFLPSRRIREGLALHHGMELPAVIPLSMTYQSSLDLRLELPGVKAVLSDQGGGASRRDCGFAFVPLPDGSAEVQVEFSTDLYEPATVEGWLAEYVEALGALEESAPARH